MPSTRDYYDVLGVGRDASPDEIKRAFRSRARDVHPDTSEHDDAEERFKELNEAYEVLSDGSKRANYDRFGTAEPQMGFPGGYGYGDPFAGGVGDLFSVIFDGIVGGSTRGQVRAEGRDMSAQVVITLDEAATGASKEVAYDRAAPCAACSGSGAAEGGGAKTCPTCRGTGQVMSVRRTFLGTFQSAAPCEGCSATGTVVEPACASCAGQGRVHARETVTVHVPPGVQDGQTVAVPGKGEAGLRGVRPGDLIVTVRVRPHEYLHREGDDLHARAAVPMTVAALGGEIRVPVFDEPVTVKVPAAAQNGDTVVVRGEGMPRQRGGRGDLVIHVNITVPRKVSKEQRKLLEQLAATMGEVTVHSTLDRVRDWLGF
jgi:molecular chaperone DnaJ